MKVLVCGGRDYNDVWRVHKELKALRPSVIIEGGCRRRHPDHSIDWTRSADAIACRWGKTYGIPVHTEAVSKADWDLFGRAAGPRRNAIMLSKYRPDVVLAFPGERGTADMVRQAKAAGVRVIEVPLTTPHPTTP